MCPLIYKYISIDRYRYIDKIGCGEHFRCVATSLKTHFFLRITMCPFGLEKVDTWTQNLVTNSQPRSYALSESGHKVDTNWTHHSEKSNPLGAHQHPKFSGEGKNEPIAPLAAASRAREPPQSYNGRRAPPILNES